MPSAILQAREVNEEADEDGDLDLSSPRRSPRNKNKAEESTEAPKAQVPKSSKAQGKEKAAPEVKPLNPGSSGPKYRPGRVRGRGRGRGGGSSSSSPMDSTLLQMQTRDFEEAARERAHQLEMMNNCTGSPLSQSVLPSCIFTTCDISSL